MWKYILFIIAPLLVTTLQAERIEVTKGRFSLEIPAQEYWRVQQASEFPNSAESMCFPRFRRGSTSISAGLWEYPYSTLEAHVDAYFVRMNRYASGSFTRELKRSSFYTASGVSGLRLLVETGKEGGNKWNLIRYVFRNNAGIVVCISASGDADVIDKVIHSLELLPPK